MSVQLIIDGNHITDVIAQVQTLAHALKVGSENAPGTPLGTVTPSKEAGATTSQDATTNSAPLTLAASQASQESTATQTAGGKTETAKTLSRKEQDEAVKYMINQGEKDDRFDLLTKGRQTEVETALAKLNAAADDKKDDADLDDMFADDTTGDKVVTREEVSALMAKVGKDEDGSPIQSRLLKIRAILVDNIPEGQEIKVKNLPEDKLASVYALIAKVEG